MDALIDIWDFLNRNMICKLRKKLFHKTEFNELVIMNRNLKLALILYPVVTAAVVLNLFMVNLILIRIGFNTIPPIYAVWIGIPLSIPVTYFVVKWISGINGGG